LRSAVQNLLRYKIMFLQNCIAGGQKLLAIMLFCFCKTSDPFSKTPVSVVVVLFKAQNSKMWILKVISVLVK
jgi:hypothetical protein